MIIDCISDLHGSFPELEGGDLLIVAGDLTATDQPSEYNDFCSWLMIQPYRKKIFVAGNHDNLFKDSLPKKICCHSGEYFEYLCDSGTELEGLKIWGSPWTRSFPGMNPRCKAFTVDAEAELASKFSLIPDNVDILVTHCPPYGILDETLKGEKCGSYSLALTLSRIQPMISVFGHMHESYGEMEASLILHPKHKYKRCIRCVNASHVNEYYEPVNKPIRIVL